MTRVASFQHRLLERWWNAIDHRLNRWLNREDIQSICALILVIYLSALGVSFATQVTGRTAFGSQLGADFGAFYVAGKIFNNVSPDRIYDRDLQRHLYHETFPNAPADEELPYVNAPFFVLLFPLLSRLPYAWAYLCWFAISLGLFTSGFTLLWRSLIGSLGADYKAGLLLALSFAPFLVECLAGGQTSAFGFFALALALSCERKGRSVLSGAALSLCAYKPTLLVLILPMLVVTRRFKTLSGFLGGGAFLAATSWLTVGWRGCLNYVNMLFYFADASTGTDTVLKSWKYVDVNSFSRLLFGEHTSLRWSLRWGLPGLAALIVLPLLIDFWWKAGGRNPDRQKLVWAFTITWTLVLNLYLGIYDATLVVLSALLTTQVFYQQANGAWPIPASFYKLLFLLLYLVPWITQPVARLTGIQLFTLILGLFGGYQLYLFRKGEQAAAIVERCVA